MKHIEICWFFYQKKQQINYLHIHTYVVSYGATYIVCLLNQVVVTHLPLIGYLEVNKVVNETQINRTSKRSENSNLIRTAEISASNYSNLNVLKIVLWLVLLTQTSV